MMNPLNEGIDFKVDCKNWAKYTKDPYGLCFNWSTVRPQRNSIATAKWLI